MFLETSAVYSGARAILLSPTIESNGIKVFAFWYHMYGSSIGSLTLEASEDPYRMRPVWVPLWMRTGEVGNAWEQAVVGMMPKWTGLRFIAVRGSSYTGDIAIDDVGVCNDCICPVGFYCASPDTIEPCSAGTVCPN